MSAGDKPEVVNGCTIFPPPNAGEIALVEGEQTGGAFSAMIGVIPEDAPRPPIHEHPTTDEAFYVAEGEAGFLLGDTEISAGPGAIVFVPMGTPHTAWCKSEGGVRGVILITPGNAEHQFVPIDED